MLLPKARDGVVVRMLVCRQIPERHIVMGGTFDAPGAGDADAISVQQQTGQQQRMICRKAAGVLALVLAVNGRQVEFVHDIGDEASEVIFRQPILQRWRKKKQLIEVANPKALVHAIMIRVCFPLSSTLQYFYLRQAPERRDYPSNRTVTSCYD